MTFIWVFLFPLMFFFSKSSDKPSFIKLNKHSMFLYVRVKVHANIITDLCKYITSVIQQILPESRFTTMLITLHIARLVVWIMLILFCPFGCQITSMWTSVKELNAPKIPDVNFVKPINWFYKTNDQFFHLFCYFFNLEKTFSCAPTPSKQHVGWCAAKVN